jgi:hypothetical protein
VVSPSSIAQITRPIDTKIPENKPTTVLKSPVIAKSENNAAPKVDNPVDNGKQADSQSNHAEVSNLGAIQEAPAHESEAYNLPGAGNHPILKLSDADLKNTPVNVMMASYGEAEGGGTCAKDFGNSLVETWRGKRKPNCKMTKSPSETKLNSKIDCFLIHQTRHHGNGDNLCLMENVAINLAVFNDRDLTTQVMRDYVQTQHMKLPYIPFPRGFLQGDCTPDPTEWKDSLMPGWNADMTVRSFQKLDDYNKDELCHEWIEHPVLFTQRDTFANFFHDSEDFVNTFLLMSILEFKPKDMQVFLTDLFPKGPFWEMWSEVYSHGHESMTSWDLKLKYKGDGNRYNVCFKQLAMGIYGPAAPITIAATDTYCTRTALIRAYSDFVIRSLGLQMKTHYASPEPKKKLTITYMSRRPSKEWPEKKYCDSQNSYFHCDYWRNFGERRLGRMVHNDQEVIGALKSLEKPSPDLNNVQIVVQAVDYNVLSFKEQIAIDLETDIMIGPHGAGLMHNIFMSDRAALIELFIDGSSANRHFHNLAFWFGRKYEGIGMTNPINTHELLDIVKRTIQDIDINSY